MPRGESIKSIMLLDWWRLRRFATGVSRRRLTVPGTSDYQTFYGLEIGNWELIVRLPARIANWIEGEK